MHLSSFTAREITRIVTDVSVPFAAAEVKKEWRAVTKRKAHQLKLLKVFSSSMGGPSSCRVVLVVLFIKCCIKWFQLQNLWMDSYGVTFQLQVLVIRLYYEHCGWLGVLISCKVKYVAPRDE